MQNISVIVYRENNGMPVDKSDRQGTPVLREVTKLPAGLTFEMLLFWEDIDPDAGSECRDKAYAGARFWLEKTNTDDALYVVEHAADLVGSRLS